ncbi:MAG: hypothetical protein IPP40_11210 [bacterium]|nr:hypothetical protein [bacterium]
MRTALNNTLTLLLLSGLLCPLVSFGQDSLNVRKVGDVKVWNPPVTANVHGSILATTAARSGIMLFDISDPVSPSELGQYPFYLPGTRVEYFGNYALFIGSDSLSSNRLYVLDISDPAHPQLNSRTSRSCNGFAVWGDTLLSQEYSNGTNVLRLYDLNADDIFDSEIGEFSVRSRLLKGVQDYVAISLYSSDELLSFYQRNPDTGFL